MKKRRMSTSAPANAPGVYLCMDDNMSLIDPRTKREQIIGGKKNSNGVKPTTAFQRCARLSFGADLFENLENCPSALQVLMFIARLTQEQGKADGDNWIYASRRAIAKRTGQSSRTITRAIVFLVEHGYLVRNGAVECVYRIPHRFLLVGPLQPVALPTREIDNDSRMLSAIFPEECISQPRLSVRTRSQDRRQQRKRA